MYKKIFTNNFVNKKLICIKSSLLQNIKYNFLTISNNKNNNNNIELNETETMLKTFVLTFNFLII